MPLSCCRALPDDVVLGDQLDAYHAKAVAIPFQRADHSHFPSLIRSSLLLVIKLVCVMGPYLQHVLAVILDDRARKGLRRGMLCLRVRWSRGLLLLLLFRRIGKRRGSRLRLLLFRPCHQIGAQDVRGIRGYRTLLRQDQRGYR